MSPLPKAFVHESPLETLAPVLESLLPYSLAVLRRIQFHFQTPHAVVVSTLDPSASPTASDRVPSESSSSSCSPWPVPSWERGTVPTSAPFAVIYIDRSRHPETEAWLFSTADLPRHKSIGGATAASSDNDSIIYGHLLSVLSLASKHYRDSASATPLGKPEVMLTGCVHEHSLRLLVGAARWDARDPSGKYGWDVTSTPQCSVKGNRSSGGVMRGHTQPWLKYLFSPPPSGEDGEVPAPDGLRWSEGLDGSDFDKITSSTAITRKADTLTRLPARTLRDGSGELVAWAFTMSDGSFGALHVVPEQRGKGVARTIVRALRTQISEKECVVVRMDGTRGEVTPFRGATRDQAWSHSDTGEDNFAAQKVLAGCGGEVGWRCYWTFVDLDEVDREAREYEKV